MKDPLLVLLAFPVGKSNIFTQILKNLPILKNDHSFHFNSLSHCIFKFIHLFIINDDHCSHLKLYFDSPRTCISFGYHNIIYNNKKIVEIWSKIDTKCVLNIQTIVQSVSRCERIVSLQSFIQVICLLYLF
jgi:hypothetical protein